ncbi:MAG: aminotransferase class III-fold pyridoxal phosphate-dependent enzyme [Candidatus Margulisbacteria bacterium]|jgi:acetylornithine/succinyldiaminopimelate/putrescine aminotransferase|nr:aminotransferase class III-fold pyridoxal phosphate-dependent enzyme [Candidatus Margulisiibacteriota bacterium]
MVSVKEQVIADSLCYWNTGKTQEWQDLGINFVMGKREGYYFWDMDGKRLMDVHINGGTFSLGHRNPEIMETLVKGLENYDIGNHHFPSPHKAALAKELIKVSPAGMTHAIFGAAGAEAVDLALKSARCATSRKKIISVENCYHGHTGLAVSAGAERFARPFLLEKDADENAKVPFNDLDAMEKEFSKGDAACVIMETIPATYGFPLPAAGYLSAVKKLCEKYGALYIADEIQTGLLRSGRMWCISTYDVAPDMIVTSKGFSGGIYPISAVVMNDQAAKWIHLDGSAHMSTYGGTELGCIVAHKVLEILQRQETVANVAFVAQYLRAGLEKIKAENQDTFLDIRQNGLIMGLVFAGAKGALPVMQRLYNEHGVWAIYSMLNNSVLQFKPGVLCTKEYCDELLERLSAGIKTSRADILSQA